MNQPSYQLLHSAIFRAFNAAYLHHTAVYSHRAAQALGVRGLHLLATQTSQALSKSFAEGEGFEPPNRYGDCRVSGAVLSASQPTFHVPPL